ncbi:hypothetical protein I215_13158 [Galbibacter marinus]|uniref:Uncharacterized protein n=1 Tax=Galbibacter marinus TaxID=555500 RepID=K2PS34_9FLAO|nr:type IV toxin-antitoxin system AbiEi family antitoxin [Galbibacter marinus]EKF54299.1 hypothetical protein I215_13158 [Galbibacter marinus]
MLKRNGKNSNYGIIKTALSEVNHLEKTIVIADYLTNSTAEELKRNQIIYLDASGNTFIKTENIFISVEGRKSHLNKNTNHSRAFQEAGLKLLLLLISNPETLQLKYRELVERTGIGLGSVSNIFKELKANHYLLLTNGKRILKRQDEIIQRWVVAYNELLKPRNFKIRMRTLDNRLTRDKLLANSDLMVYLSGELGGELLTGNLKSKNYTIYTSEELSSVAREFKLFPDKTGNIELYNKFWNDNLELKIGTVAPPLVVYADLIGTGIDRNIEIENDCVSEKVVTFKRLEIFHSTCLNLLSNVSFFVEITLIFLA